ncbi:MAG TPA: ABC transporter ATP-binding protein, partial [Gemmatimonadales bacterium]|nr:ABC transporter ATP-binding protein [Gemmatimonadales bacterium]
GPNGAGKTTTIRMLLGLLPPDAGGAVVAGVTLPAADRDGARLRAQAGLLTEAPGFYDRMSGWENLTLFGRLYGLDGNTLRARMEHWLKRLDLWDARERVFGTWSKGMKQRLALIRAVLHQPSVIFLDEPTAGLDPAGAREVRELILDFKREGRTILLSTHHLVEAEQLADLIGILRCTLLAFGTPAALTAAPPEIEVRLGGPAEPLLAAMRAVAGVVACRASGAELRISLADPVRDTPAVVRTLVERGAPVLAVRPVRPSLEEVYLRAVQGVPA